MSKDFKFTLEDFRNGIHDPLHALLTDDDFTEIADVANAKLEQFRRAARQDCMELECEINRLKESNRAAGELIEDTRKSAYADGHEAAYCELLGDAPVLNCRQDDGVWACDEHPGFARTTHTGLLVCIEKIEGK